jgi:hypothetical protein
MNIGLETQEKDGFLIPKVNIQDFDISFDAGSFSFDFDCSACPGDLANLLLELFKGPLLDEIRNQAKNVVNSEVVGKVNEILREEFPVSVVLSDGLSMSSATTGPVKIKTDYLNVPIDATIFLTNEGYNRPFDAPEIPTEDPDHPGEILLFISEYVYQTATKSANMIPMTFQHSVLGFDTTIEIDGTKVPIKLDTRDGHLHVLGGAIVSVPFFRTVIEIGASADIDLTFRAGDSDHMFFVNPGINRSSMKFTDLKLKIFGIPLNFNLFNPIINFFVTLILDWVAFPEFAIPKLDLMPITATTAKVDFFDTYTLAGIAFNFGLDY